MAKTRWNWCGFCKSELLDSFQRERERYHTPSVELSMECCASANIVCAVGLGWKDRSMQSFEKSRKTHTIANAK